MTTIYVRRVVLCPKSEAIEDSEMCHNCEHMKEESPILIECGFTDGE